MVHPIPYFLLIYHPQPFHWVFPYTVNLLLHQNFYKTLCTIPLIRLFIRIASLIFHGKTQIVNLREESQVDRGRLIAHKPSPAVSASVEDDHVLACLKSSSKRIHALSDGK